MKIDMNRVSREKQTDFVLTVSVGHGETWGRLRITPRQERVDGQIVTTANIIQDGNSSLALEALQADLLSLLKNHGLINP